MITEYEMTEAEYGDLLEACKPVPYMVFRGVEPTSPQENANRAWQSLAARYGFDWRTVNPVAGKSPRFFTAEMSS